MRALQSTGEAVSADPARPHTIGPEPSSCSSTVPFASRLCGLSSTPGLPIPPPAHLSSGKSWGPHCQRPVLHTDWINGCCPAASGLSGTTPPSTRHSYSGYRMQPSTVFCPMQASMSHSNIDTWRAWCISLLVPWSHSALRNSSSHLQQAIDRAPKRAVGESLLSFDATCTGNRIARTRVAARTHHVRERDLSRQSAASADETRELPATCTSRLELAVTRCLGTIKRLCIRAQMKVSPVSSQSETWSSPS